MALGPEWRKLPLTLAELCIDTVLRCGQSFRWQKFDDTWMCVLHGRVLSLRQDPAHLHYRVNWPEDNKKKEHQQSPQDDTEALLQHYFALHLDLPALYKQWGDADANFRRRAPGFGGVRMLGQDAWEALVCFICSSNNNISRISQMTHKLCNNYGPFVATVDGRPFHDFPTAEALTVPGVEASLRSLGFGYRAKYIADTARVVALDRPPHWLNRLRNPAHPAFGATPDEIDPEATYKAAHDALVQLMGVGPKVADCVCLMGLGWGGAIPVDTHVWQIAQRDYRYGGGRAAKTKTLTKAMYDGIGDLFRGLWGEYAGWAHSVLFTADLKSFAEQGKVGKVKKVKADVEEEVVGEDGEEGEEVKVKVEEDVKVKVEVKEEKQGQLKLDGGLEEPAKATRATRKRTRTEVKTEDNTEVKTEDNTEVNTEANQNGEYHTSISETVAKRRRMRASYKT